MIHEPTGLVAAANPAKQLVAWFAELLASIPQHWETVSTAAAISIAAYLTMTLLSRWRGNGTDPSVWKQTESDAGSMSILISGVYVTVFLVGMLAFFLWPMPVENPGVGVALLLAVVFHYRLEKREVTS